MITLITETENLHTGALSTTREVLLMTEEKAKEHKAWVFSKLKSMHMRSDHRLSRLYFEKK